MNAPIRILLVEDNPHDVTLIEDVLRSSGLEFTAKCVDNERDFLQRLERDTPDLILSDHGLAHFGGWTALSVARQRLPEVPFIFFTSSHGEQAAIDAFKGGAVDYILKNRMADLVPAVQRALAQAEDREKRHNAEEALRRSQESFRMLVESVKDYAIYMLDEKGRITTWNPGAERLEGYSASEILGQQFSIFFTAEDRQAGKPAELLRIAATEGRIEDEGWRVRKDGSRFWSQVVCTAIRDASGKLTGFSKVAHDTTDQKVFEDKLKAHIQQQASVAELGQQALRATRFSDFMNQAATMLAEKCGADFAMILELQPTRNQFLVRAGAGLHEGVVGRTIVDATAMTHAGYAFQSDRPIIFEDLSQETRFAGAPVLQDHGVTSGFNVIIRQREGPYGVLGVYTRQRRQFSEEDIHFVQAVANVLSAAIQRKKSQEQLRRFNRELESRVAQRTAQLEAANKELESFSYSVSHDLRTPLRHISGFIEMLQRTAEAKLDPSARETLQIIANSAKKMDDLINDLLTLSRTGATEMRAHKINMINLVESARHELRGEMQGREVAWSVGALPEAVADPVLLRQVWINLLSNALKYSRNRSPSRIEIGAQEEEQEWIFYVRDNGVGFDAAYAHKLFGVFQRLHPTREFEGTGIGLAIVRRIIARHGGRTWAESKRGQGAVFYFSLPKLGGEVKEQQD